MVTTYIYISPTHYFALLVLCYRCLLAWRLTRASLHRSKDRYMVSTQSESIVHHCTLRIAMSVASMDDDIVYDATCVQASNPFFFNGGAMAWYGGMD